MLGALHLFDRLIDKLPVSPRFIRFCVVGTSGMAVSFVALWLINWALPSTWGPWEHRVALAGSIVIAIFTNFLLNYNWTWGDTDRAAGLLDWFGKLGRFYRVSAVAASVQYIIAVLVFELSPLNAWLLALLERVSGDTAIINEPGLYVAQATGIATAMFINYFANHLWTFQDKGEQNAVT